MYRPLYSSACSRIYRLDRAHFFVQPFSLLKLKGITNFRQVLGMNRCLVVAMFTIHFCTAQPGTLDSSFGGRGFKYFRTGTTSSFNVQPDGKFILAKTVMDSLYLLRYKADATVDSSFG